MYFKNLITLTILATILSSSSAKAANPDHIRELQNTGSCEACDLTNADLHRMNLQGANLQFSDLQGANLAGVDLSNANLRGALISHKYMLSDPQKMVEELESNLENANLRGANLENAKLIGANLNGANLKDANLRITDLSASLINSNMMGVEMSGSHPNMGADLRRANISYGKLNACIDNGQEIEILPSAIDVATHQKAESWRGKQILQYNLKGANASTANFQNASLAMADLSGMPDLPGVNFNGVVSVKNLDLRGANTIGAIPNSLPTILQAKGAIIGDNPTGSVGGALPSCH